MSLQSFPLDQTHESLAQQQTSTADHSASQSNTHANGSSQSFITTDYQPQIDFINCYSGSDHNNDHQAEQNTSYPQNAIPTYPQYRQSATSTQPTERSSIFSHQSQLSNASSHTTAPSVGNHLSRTSLQGLQGPYVPTIQENELSAEEEAPPAAAPTAGVGTLAAGSATPAEGIKRRPLLDQPAFCPVGYCKCARRRGCMLRYLYGSHLDTHLHKRGEATAVRQACSLCDRSPFNSNISYVAHLKNHISPARDVECDKDWISGDEYLTDMNNMARAITRQLLNLLRCSDLIACWFKVCDERGIPLVSLWEPTDRVLDLRDELCHVGREEEQKMERIMNDLVNNSQPIPDAQSQVDAQRDISQSTPSTSQQQHTTPEQMLASQPHAWSDYIDTESAQPFPPAAFENTADASAYVPHPPSPPYRTDARQEPHHPSMVATNLLHPASPWPAPPQDQGPWPVRSSSLPQFHNNAPQQPHVGSGSGNQPSTADSTNNSSVPANGQQVHSFSRSIKNVLKMAEHRVRLSSKNNQSSNAQEPSVGEASRDPQQQLPYMTPPPVREDDAVVKRSRSSKSSHRPPSDYIRPRRE